MEDAAALAAVLPSGTAPCDVPGRLKVFNDIRYKRAHTIQEYSRQAGKDWINGKPQIDSKSSAGKMLNISWLMGKVMAYTQYNFGHDEHDYATHYFKKWQSSWKEGTYFGAPIGFGIFPGPRQDNRGQRRPSSLTRAFTTASVRFKTSRTFLETIFPTQSFSFRDRATVCLASFSVTTPGSVSGLGGDGCYSSFGLYLHGVEYRKKDGTSVLGSYLPVVFENLADSVISGREEIGIPKLFCDINIKRRSNTYHMEASWRGTSFAEISLSQLEVDDPRTESRAFSREVDYDTLAYRYVPAVGAPGQADAEYAIVVPGEEEKVVCPSVNAVWRSKDASVRIDARDWSALPTLHHVTSILAEIPIYEVVSAKVVEGTGMVDESSARRIE
jgi:hypothetical protein